MNVRTRALVFGGVIGALLGALGGWLYFNANVQVDEEEEEALEPPTAGDALKLVLGVLGVLRLITD